MKIERLRKLVQEGRYEVPAEEVAAAIITWYDPLAFEPRPPGEPRLPRQSPATTPINPAPERSGGHAPGPPRP